LDCFWQILPLPFSLAQLASALWLALSWALLCLVVRLGHQAGTIQEYTPQPQLSSALLVLEGGVASAVMLGAGK
jgi:hypothetical protein